MEIAFDTTESEKEKMQLKYTMEADQMSNRLRTRTLSKERHPWQIPRSWKN